MTKFTTEEKVEQWVESYRAGTDGEIKAALKAFYKMECWQDLHKALWAWLSLNGKREKEEWFKAFSVPKVTNYCFACEEAGLNNPEKEGCNNCPLLQDARLGCANGFYLDWWCTRGKTERKEHAYKIAVMEWEEKQ